jgi:hypothetical protein
MSYLFAAGRSEPGHNLQAAAAAEEWAAAAKSVWQVGGCIPLAHVMQLHFLAAICYEVDACAALNQ